VASLSLSSLSSLLSSVRHGDVDVHDEHEEEVEVAADRLEQASLSVLSPSPSSSSRVRSIGRSALPPTPIGSLVSVSLSTSRGLTV
jgi:hypothetical protein